MSVFVKSIIRKWAIVFVIALAVFFRFYRLGSVPSSMNADEVAIGYNAYSILKTGRDEFGQKYPLAFRSFDDYKAPLYVYLTVPSIGIFGLTDYAVRLPSATFGVIAVVAVYFMTRELVGFAKKERFSEWIPLVAAGMLSVSPWHIQFSRSAYEASLAVCFIPLGMWLFFVGLRKGWALPLSAAAFSLSLWSYHTPRIFLPLLLVVIAFLYWKDIFKRWKWGLVALVVGVIMSSPMMLVMLSPEGAVRAKGVSSLSNPAILARSVGWTLDDMRQGQTGRMAGLFHNRRIEYARTVLNGYISHFDPAFLFGERSEGKYHAPGVGLLYWFELPLLVVGAYRLMKNRSRVSWLLGSWILLAPVAASPTLQLPHPVRTIVFMPAFEIVAGVGLIAVLEKTSKWKKFASMAAGLAVVVVISVSVAYYFHQYFSHLSIDYAREWQFGYKQVVESVAARLGKYDTVLVSTKLDEPHIFFLYYLKYDPKLYLSEGGTVSGKFDADQNKFGKFLFTTLSKGTFLKHGTTLYVTQPDEMVYKDAVLIDTIRYPDGAPAYVLFERNPFYVLTQ